MPDYSLNYNCKNQGQHFSAIPRCAGSERVSDMEDKATPLDTKLAEITA